MRNGREQVQEVLSDPISRKRFLAGTGALVGLLSLQQAEIARAAAGRGRRLSAPKADPFTLGVASGEPASERLALWTRLAPDPLSGALASPSPLRVEWEVYRDADLRRVVQRGNVWARPEDAHSVHVDVDDLEPGRPYWYRFRSGSFLSPVGRTRTMPEVGESLAHLRFGFCSCSDWQNGQFAAYARMAEEELDFVLHLGDYIYEYGPAQSSFAGREHTMPEAGEGASQLTTLGDYRARHAQYKTDPALQAAHASTPWLVVWDDHEVENNYADDIDEIGEATDPATFLLQRAAAYKAYWEHMPLPRKAQPAGPDLQLYRRARFGDLLDLHLLDTRQYRTDQPVDLSSPVGAALAAQDFRPSLPSGGNPAGTLMGTKQEAWLLGNLDRSRARWNVLGQQVMMARFNFGSFIPLASGGPVIFNVDQWDGYGAERQRILDFVASRDDLDLVVLTGDIHSAWVHDLKASFDDSDSETVATEFVTSSVTADFPAALWAPVEAAAAYASPWTRYLDARRRGYAVCTVERDSWRTDFRAVQSTPIGQVATTDASVTTAASFVVERGKPGAVPA